MIEAFENETAWNRLPGAALLSWSTRLFRRATVAAAVPVAAQPALRLEVTTTAAGTVLATVHGLGSVSALGSRVEVTGTFTPTAATAFALRLDRTAKVGHGAVAFETVMRLAGAFAVTVTVRTADRTSAHTLKADYASAR